MNVRFLLMGIALLGSGCSAGGDSNGFPEGLAATGGAPGPGGMVPGAGGQFAPGSGGQGFPGAGGQIVPGAGGQFVPGAGGQIVPGAGGQFVPGAGGAPAAGGAPGAGGTPPALPNFSFFVTSLAALQRVSGNQSGFGGDLRFGEMGDRAGLRGADKICTAIAEASMPGSGQKQWRAFLSTSYEDAIDRVGEGPWYDRLGRLLAMRKTDLTQRRPAGGDPAIANDLPNEDGVPNHAPDPGAGEVDNHDTITGSNGQGRYFGSLRATCNDWTSAVGTDGTPRVGQSWPRVGFPDIGVDAYGAWISALDEAGCAPGVNIIEMGPPNPFNPTVGSGGGYGGFYCFALTP